MTLGWNVGGLGNAAGDYAHDNPVIALDLATGGKRVLCRLNAVLRERRLPRFQSNFAAALSPDETRLCLAPNLSEGRVVLVTLALPREK